MLCRRLRVLGASVAAAALLVSSCGDDAVDRDRLADLEPEEAVADLPGVRDAERTYDVQEDDFYVNDLVVSVKAGIDVDDLTRVLEVVDYYGEAEEPVTGIVLLDGEVDSRQDVDESSDSGIWLNDGDAEQFYGDDPGPSLREKAVLLLSADAAVEQPVTMAGDDIFVHVADDGDPEEIAEAAARLLEVDGLPADASVVGDERALSGRADALAGLLADWDRLREVVDAETRLGTPDLSMTQRSGTDAIELDICLDVGEGTRPEDIGVDRSQDWLVPVVEEILAAARRRPGSWVRVGARPGPLSGIGSECEPLLDVSTDPRDEPEREPTRRDWQALGERVLLGTGTPR